MSSITSTCPSQSADAPMPMVGIDTAAVISPRQPLGHLLQHHREGPRLGDRLGVGHAPARPRRARPLHLVAAERRSPPAASGRHAPSPGCRARPGSAIVARHVQARPPASPPAHPVSFISRAALRKACCGDLPRSCRTACRPPTIALRAPRITAWPCRIIISSVTPTVVGRPCTTMPDAVADQQQVAVRIDQPRHRRGVGGQADDRLATLARPDRGRGQGLLRHGDAHEIPPGLPGGRTNPRPVLVKPRDKPSARPNPDPRNTPPRCRIFSTTRSRGAAPCPTPSCRSRSTPSPPTRSPATAPPATRRRSTS